MVERIHWFDRQFSFDLPVWLFPNILERLRGTPARIRDRVEPLPGAWLTRRDGDTWSIQENIGHLLDLEPLWMGRVEDFLVGKETLRPADLTNRRTHEANHNGAPIEDIVASFRSARLHLIKRLETCDESAVLRSSVHPRLKTEMRLLDMAFFIAEHDDHHLARVTELIHIARARI